MSNSFDSNKNRIRGDKPSSGRNNLCSDRTLDGDKKLNILKIISVYILLTYPIASTLAVPYQGIQLSLHYLL